MAEKEYCGTCYYFGWNGLKKWCRHPDNNREIKKFESKCKLWCQYDEKIERIPKIPQNQLPKEEA